MLLENTVYRRGEKLRPEHQEMLLFIARNTLDYITTNGWLTVSSGGHVNFVMFSTEAPAFLK